jgi:hypothetical protein
MSSQSSPNIPPATLTERDAARYIGLSRAYLRQSRMRLPRRGIDAPPYLRVGRAIRYLRGDLDRWLEAHRVVSATPASPHISENRGPAGRLRD